MSKYIIIMLVFVSVLCQDFKAKTQNDFYKAQGLDLNFYTESGYVKIDGPDQTSENLLFYHLFLKDGVKVLVNIQATDIFTLWLNGGPGCASQFGNFEEIGPIKITKDGATPYKLTLRETSWNKLGHQIFVDQPFNVGLSYSTKTDLVKSTEDAANYMVKFLKIFFENRPTLKTAKFYIAGESFAGHYIPAIAAKIIEQNLIPNFKGVAIGDGWTTPFNQVEYFSSYLFNIGVIDGHRSQNVEQLSVGFQNAAMKEDWKTATQKFDDASGDNISKATGGMSVYNIQQYEDSPEAYIGFINDHLADYEAPKGWRYEGCNGKIYEQFVEDIPQSKNKANVEYLLAHNIRVLLFNGQLDYIVNTPGALQWINQLEWTDIYSWKAQNKQIFKAANSDGIVETAGTVKLYKNLVFATVYRAGHMVPTDNPPAAYVMIDNFYKEKADWTI